MKNIKISLVINDVGKTYKDIGWDFVPKGRASL